MMSILRSAILGVALLGTSVSCSNVPYTGRTQFDFIPRAQELQLGEDAYAQILSENERSTNEVWQEQLNRVGNWIKDVTDEPDFNWEFTVLAGDAVNAFVLPGGKVAFWEGIMPLCGDDTGVAVVMGHEIAHAIAGHGGERMSQVLGAQLVGQLLQVGLGGVSESTRQLALAAYGVGAQVGVLLPYSRKQESEADYIGLILMAKAGYDPRAAVPFWERMHAHAGGAAPPEFLSTHPGHQTRIDKIKGWLPKVMDEYYTIPGTRR